MITLWSRVATMAITLLRKCIFRKKIYSRYIYRALIKRLYRQIYRLTFISDFHLLALRDMRR